MKPTLFLTALLSLGFLLPAAGTFGAPAKPNIIIILADDMGYNGTSAFGGWIKTPNLERMAAQGMKFTDFHSSGVVCSPTRCGFVTGRYQERAGIPGVVLADPNLPVHYTGLQTSEVTYPKLLKPAGYTCAIFGKWHLGYDRKYNPMHHGFDRFHGYVSGNVDYLSHYDMKDNYDWWEGLETVKEEGYTTHLINRHARGFIEANRNRPFCLYIAHEAVHAPYQGPNSQIGRGPDKGKRAGAVELTKDEAYTQMMTEMDKGVGEVLDTVNRLGLAQNTLVFFFSDNGHAADSPKGPAGYHFPLRGHKGQVWEGGHRIPAIAWWPGRIQPGMTNRDLCISLDLFPTMLELAGAPAPKNHRLDGMSLVGALLRGEHSGARKVFWKGEAMRDGDWKYVAGRDGGLFNLKDDPMEQNDLTAKEPARVKTMDAALEAWKVDVATGATQQPEPPPGLKPEKKKKKNRQRAAISPDELSGDL